MPGQVYTKSTLTDVIRFKSVNIQNNRNINKIRLIM